MVLSFLTLQSSDGHARRDCIRYVATVHWTMFSGLILQFRRWKHIVLRPCPSFRRELRLCGAISPHRHGHTSARLLVRDSNKNPLTLISRVVVSGTYSARTSRSPLPTSTAGLDPASTSMFKALTEPSSVKLALPARFF